MAGIWGTDSIYSVFTDGAKLHGVILKMHNAKFTLLIDCLMHDKASIGLTPTKWTIHTQKIAIITFQNVRGQRGYRRFDQQYILLVLVL